MKKIKVAVLVGSDSDLTVIASATKILDEFTIPYTITVSSAHRTPEKVRKFIKNSEKQGAEVFIAAAGMAAALPGVVASETTKPVIGIPVEGKSLSGLDALLSIVQMPPGIPVATVAVGKAGAVNAALLAAGILAIKDARLGKLLRQYRAGLAASVTAKDRQLQKLGLHEYIKSHQK